LNDYIEFHGFCPEILGYNSEKKRRCWRNIIDITGIAAHGQYPKGKNGIGDEDEGSLPRGRVNRKKQVSNLDPGKIERSAEALQEDPDDSRLKLSNHFACLSLFSGMENRPILLSCCKQIGGTLNVWNRGLYW
jgi:hypothetical protein